MKLIRFLTVLALFASAPLVAIAQTPSDPAGDWRGTLSAGAVKMRVALHLGTASSFDSLDQGALGLPARMTSEGRRVTVTIEKAGVFEGELSEDGSQLVGALVQGPARTPLTLER
jgi:hypothetical protein